MKIGIVGCGMVGATSAYALVMGGVGWEIVLVDLNRARAEAEVNDIHHAYSHAYGIGEHGDSEVLAWSQATIAGLGVDEFVKVHGMPLTRAQCEAIDEQVRRAAYHIIAGKGSTNDGIGSAVARIVDVLLHDQHAILTICTRIVGVPGCEDVTLALPHLVRGEGALATIPLPLDATEQAGLQRSAGILRDAIESLGVDSA